MDENISLLPSYQNDYIGMATDIRRMLDRFYEYRNQKWLAFMLNREESEFLNELVTFRIHCKEMEASTI